MGFRSYIRHFFGRNFDAFPSFRALLFEHGGGAGVFGRNFDAFPSFRALLFERGGGAVSELGNQKLGH